jgi:hypothetical protein
MAITTYAELQTAVSDWLHRTNLTARVPDFIRLAEATINRRLQIYPKEITVSLSPDVGTRLIPLPSDYGSPIALWNDYISPRQEVEATTVDQLPVNESVSGPPRYWAIDGANIALNIMADQNYPLQFCYVQNIYLSDSTPTNSIFAAHPDLYLYGALAQSAPYTRDDARLPMWKSEFERALREVAAEASRSRGVATLRTEITDVMIDHYPSRRRYW